MNFWIFGGVREKEEWTDPPRQMFSSHQTDEGDLYTRCELGRWSGRMFLSFNPRPIPVWTSLPSRIPFWTSWRYRCVKSGTKCREGGGETERWSGRDGASVISAFHVLTIWDFHPSLSSPAAAGWDWSRTWVNMCTSTAASSAAYSSCSNSIKLDVNSGRIHNRNNGWIRQRPGKSPSFRSISRVELVGKLFRP